MGNGRLQVASTFTSTPIRDSLRAAVVNADIAEDVEFILYARMNEYMLRPGSAGAEVVGTIILLRLEDWLRNDLKSTDPETNADALARRQLLLRTDEFVRQLASFSQRSRQVWFLACPSTGWIANRHKLTTLCRTHTNVLLARVRKLPVTFLDCPAFLFNGECDDHSADRLGQMPYSQDAFDQLGEFLGSAIARSLQARDLISAPVASTGSAELAAYLAGLRVQVNFVPAEAGNRVHVERLLRTAADFSLIGQNPNIQDAEVDRLLESRNCFLVAVSDRLSDYGPTGFVFLHGSENALVVDAMALSCIVLGKQVEFAVLVALAQYAAEHNLDRIVFEYNPSGRNQPVHAFLQSIGDSESATRFVVPVSTLEARIKTAAASPGTWTVKFEPTLDHPGVLS